MWRKARTIDLHTDYFKLPPKYKVVNGIKTAYREFGRGKKIVFALPPWPYSGISFTPLALALEEDVHMIMVDLPGLGGMSDDFNQKATLENYQIFTEKFIESFGIDDYSILGYSMGGIIGHMIATSKRLTPNKLILVSTLFNAEKLYPDTRWFITLNNILRHRMRIPHPFLQLLVADNLMYELRKGQYYKRYKNSVAFKHMVQQNLHYNVNQVLDMVVCLADGVSTPGWVPSDIETLIIYADGDMEPFKSESIAMAQHMEIEPVVLDNADHEHLFFDVNKSSDLILNFLLA